MDELRAVQLRRIVDQQCDEFEAAWAKGERPEIGQYLGAADPTERGQLFGELLAVELELRARSGDCPETGHYLREFPNYAEYVKSAFDDFREWTCKTTIVTPAVKSRVLAGGEVTENQALETAEWSGTESGSARDDQYPQQVGRYQVLRPLGRGGMGTVLLAKDPVLERRVAVKLPRIDVAEETVQRFYREARAMASVHHPNLCPIHDIGELEGHPYLAMAYIDGSSLSEAIAAHAPFEPSRCANLVRTLALAMHAMHLEGVVHRDIKPSNVMLDQDGRPYITDFGLATRDRPTESDLTRSGSMIGTPAYMALEQVRGEFDRINAQTDVYALGVILYELLSGRRPYKGPAVSVLGQITAQMPFPRLSELVDVDPELEAICVRAMAPEMGDRYSSGAEFAAALAPFAASDLPITGAPDGFDSSSPISQETMVRPGSAQAKTHRLSRKLVVSTLAVVLLAALTALAIWQANKGGSKQMSADALSKRRTPTAASPEREKVQPVRKPNEPQSTGSDRTRDGSTSQSEGMVLSDDFDNQKLDPERWAVVTHQLDGSPKAVQREGRMELSGRAFLNTIRQFDVRSGKVTVSGTWEFHDGADEATVVTRCDGVPGTGFGIRPCGIRFSISPVDGGKVVIDKDVAGENFPIAVDVGMGIQVGRVYRFVVTDDGTDLTFTVVDVLDAANTVTLKATDTTVFSKYLVTFHNREGPRTAKLGSVRLLVRSGKADPAM